MNRTLPDDYRVQDSWGCTFSGIKVWVRTCMTWSKNPEPIQRLGKRWRIKVGGISYGEMWLRRYVQMRQFHNCVTMASDWANRMTGEDKPIVRDLDTDLELLLAHAKLQSSTREVVVRKGTHAP